MTDKDAGEAAARSPRLDQPKETGVYQLSRKALKRNAALFRTVFKPVTYEPKDDDSLDVRMLKKIHSLAATVKHRGTPMTDDELRTIHSAAFAALDGPDPPELESAVLPRAPEPDLESIVRAWLADPHRQFATTGSRYTTVATHELESLAEALRASRGEARVQSETAEKNDDDAVSRCAPSDG